VASEHVDTVHFHHKPARAIQQRRLQGQITPSFLGRPETDTDVPNRAVTDRRGVGVGPGLLGQPHQRGRVVVHPVERVILVDEDGLGIPTEAVHVVGHHHVDDARQQRSKALRHRDPLIGHSGQSKRTSGQKCARAKTPAPGILSGMDRQHSPERGRFQDTTWGVLEFADDDIHVVCPRCTGHAVVTAAPDAPGHDSLYPLRRPRRLVCRECLHRAGSGSVLYLGNRGRDPFFDAELWLTTQCCGQTLWAFNASHLAFLEAYVSATVREHLRNEYQMVTLGERLPTWITSRKNRGEILRGLARLRRMLGPRPPSSGDPVEPATAGSA
jgi:hypothetical protein